MLSKALFPGLVEPAATWMLIGQVIFVVGVLAGVYVIYKAKGRRALLPFIRGRSRIHAYHRGIRRYGWPRIPLYAWVLGIPVGVLLMIAAILKSFAR